MAYSSFVILAGMRTGSNHLEASLAALPGVRCHGELFNPGFIGKQGATDRLGFDLAARDRDPLRFMAAVAAASDGLWGFRLFADHDPRVLDAVLSDRACAKIVLGRNPVESYVSRKIAQSTGQWLVRKATTAKSAVVPFDEAEFGAYLAAQAAFHRHVQHRLQISGQTAFRLDHADLNDVDVLNGLARFLGLDVTLERPDQTLKRQNPGPLVDKVANPAAMAAALARVDWAGLHDTPLLEPRRGPAIPTLVASADAPLLWMPVAGGPTARVEQWLGGLGEGGLVGAFTQRSLREWKRDRPGHRSFTVVSHPAPRAYRVFCTSVLAAEAPTLCLALGRRAGAPRFAPGEALTVLQTRQAFVAFLELVAQTHAGRTPLRMDASLATQAAILQGFAAAQSPDRVLREDALGAGLAQLCDELGLAMPDLGAEPPVGVFPLAEIWTDEVARAVEATYRRDFIAFGFGPYAA